ncbi:2Fe-2S ferredoxin-type domain-containing protein [Chytriomyces cf. hyalinus JEL632]|nr:2Fe-2S ferredoxin-type domain-containing protein [Chytriomyces cf. hyalinus JEL632]
MFRHSLRHLTAKARPFQAPRFLSSSTISRHTNATKKLKEGEGYAVSYIQQDGTKKTVYAKDGWNLLDLAHSNNIELEGACEGSLACSTCHVVMQKEFYEKLEEPSDEENDMLDLAFGLTETSRLGCQVEMSKDLDGMTVRIPSASRNIKQEKM